MATGKTIPVPLQAICVFRGPAGRQGTGRVRASEGRGDTDTGTDAEMPAVSHDWKHTGKGAEHVGKGKGSVLRAHEGTACSKYGGSKREPDKIHQKGSVRRQLTKVPMSAAPARVEQVLVPRHRTRRTKGSNAAKEPETRAKARVMCRGHQNVPMPA